MIEHDSLKSLKQDLRGERKLGFVRARSTNEFDMYAKMKAKYPTWTKIMSSIADILHLHEPRHVHDSYQDVLGLSESCKESIIAQPGMEEPVGDDGVGRH